MTSTMQAKKCTLCNKKKNVDEFHLHAKGRLGRQSRCKECAIAVARAAYKADPESKKALVMGWNSRNPEKVHHSRHASKLRKYGLEPADYDRMMESQSNACAICRTDDPGRGRAWFCVDHDHETGRVRGLLCMDCNDGLGRFKDSDESLSRAISYLKGGDF